MTHLYTVLVGGVVIPGGDEPDASAIVWAADVVIALGRDDAVRSISRGDSHFIDLAGACVIPIAGDADAGWPVDARLEVGGRADLAVLSSDPRTGRAHRAGSPTSPAVRTLAVVRGGRVVKGALPGPPAHEDHDHSHA